MTTTLPRVGDTLTTAEQLDAMPVGSIFLSPSDAVWRRMDESESEGGHRFESLEYDGRFQAATFARFGEFPLRVLYVPGEPSRPSVTDNARAEWVAALERECIQADAAMQKWVRVPVKAVRAALAAGRAETTTEGDGPVSETGHRWPCIGFYLTSTPEDRTSGCTCTFADPAETTTATVEDAARVLVDHGLTSTALSPSDLRAACMCGKVYDRDLDRPPIMAVHPTHQAQVLAVAGLLATARTNTTEAQAEALEAAAEDVNCLDDHDLLRCKAAAIREGDDQ